MKTFPLALPILLAGCALAQSPVPIPPSSEQFYSMSPVSPPSVPPGGQLALVFPGQTAGSQNQVPGCGTFESLVYAHYNYNLGAGTWSAALTGVNTASSPTTFFESRTPTPNWAGFTANVAMTGTIGSNSSQTTQNHIQAFYFSTSQCFEYGPEYGFYKLQTIPGDGTQERTVHFYYGVNVNCFNVSSLGSCRDKTTGVSLVYHVVDVPMTIPLANSHGTGNLIYSVVSTSPTQLRVNIKDPYTLADVSTEQNLTVDSFFQPMTAQMFSTGLTGYLTFTQQRTSPAGALTDSMTNPLKLTVYAMAQLAILSAPAVAQGMQSANVWCSQGGQGVYAPTKAGNTAVSRSMQQSYPKCNVSVFVAGTSTLATIYSNNNPSPTPLSNPFQSAANGFGQFYAPNGRYTVQLSGGGLSSPVNVGDLELFDYSTWIPTNFYVSGVLGVYGQNSNNYTLGFKAPTLTQSTVWIWPASDSAGCLSSNGSGVLSFVACGGGGGGGTTPGGFSTSIQYNSGGGFGGDGNFTWDPTLRLVTITGIGGSPSLRINSGYVLSTGGYVAAAGSWQGFNTNTDGALLRGLHVAPDAAGVSGGYINMAPLVYANSPVPLPGLSSFGIHTALLWVAGANPASPDTTFGVNTNLYMDAAGGFRTNNTPFNSVQAPTGGMFAKSFTALNYIQVGTSSGAPSLTANDSFQPGALYWDTTAGGLRVWNGSSWATTGAGGTGSPGGATTNVQFNNSSAFGGSSNFIWLNSTQVLRVTALNAASAGIAVDTGFIQSATGFLATAGTATSFNAIQAPGGGMAALSFTAVSYIQVGTSAGAPTPTTSDTFHAGAMYWDTGTSDLKLWNGSGWATVSTGGATSPGGADTNLQYNSGGAFAGTSNLIWLNSSQILRVTATGAGAAAIAVDTGFIQSATGFLAVTGTATSYNAIQAAGGGMAAKNFTATGYVQVGNATSTPTVTTSDTFHAGAMYYNTANACLEVYGGTTWSCVASGGGSTPGGTNTSVQFNNSGSFGGDSFLTYSTGSHLLNVVAVANTAGMNVQSGFMQADTGFVVAVSGQYNSVQTTATGGMAARSFTATTYIQAGNSAGAPTATTSDSFHAGALYWDTSGTPALKVHNGSGWVALATATGGVSSINTLTGAVSLAGTANEITITPAANTLVFSTPQPIGTGSSVTFASVVASGAFNSQAAGAAISFQNANTNFQVDGNGNVSSAGQFNATGAASVYKMGGAVSINHSNQFVGAGVNVGASGISAGGYNVNGGFIGQTYTVTIPGMSIAGNSCTGGLTFVGGVLVSCF